MTLDQPGETFGHGRGELPWPAPARAWWAVAVFFFAAILSYSDRQILLILIDPVRGELILSDTQVGLLQGLAFALVYSLAGLPLGRAADRLPRRLVIIGGIVVWSVATFACAHAHTFTTLFLARLFVGVGEACLAPAALSMIGDYLPPARRSTGIGIFVLGMVVGSGAAVMIGGGVLQAVQDGLVRDMPYLRSMAPWRAVVLLMALPGLAMVLLVLTVPEPARRSDRADMTLEDGEKDGALAWLWQRRTMMIPLYLGMATLSVAENAMLSWVPALLTRHFAMHPAEIGGHYGGALIASAALGIVGGGLLADALVARGVAQARLRLLAAAALLSLPGLLAGLGTSAGMVIALAALFCMMSSATLTIAIAAIQEVVPNRMRGVASAISSVGNILIGAGLGAVLTPWVDATLFDGHGRLPLAMTTAALPMGVLAVALFASLINVRSTRTTIIRENIV